MRQAMLSPSMMRVPQRQDVRPLPDRMRDAGVEMLHMDIMDGHFVPNMMLGTSKVPAALTGAFAEIPGICGVVANGFVDGLYGIDSGQACTGDMLDWFVRRAPPGEIIAEARGRNDSAYDALRSRVRAPWRCRVAAVDWFNGSRNAPAISPCPVHWRA